MSGGSLVRKRPRTTKSPCRGSKSGIAISLSVVMGVLVWLVRDDTGRHDAPWCKSCAQKECAVATVDAFAVSTGPSVVKESSGTNLLGILSQRRPLPFLWIPFQEIYGICHSSGERFP